MTASFGVVTAARAEAAAAGASILRNGGNAADAAVATAFALCVTDPANCGIGGYGGFAIIDGPQACAQVNFNTRVPRAFEITALANASRRGPFLFGGVSVAPPAVVEGLAHLHRAFGRTEWAQVMAPAIALAEDGFEVGPDLARAIAWAFSGSREFGQGLRPLLSAGGQPLAARDRLRQSDLAATLREIALHGAEALRHGFLADAIVHGLKADERTFDFDDLQSLTSSQSLPTKVTFADATILSGDADETAFSIVADIVNDTNASEWRRERDEHFAERVASHLNDAWARRDRRFRSLTDVQPSTVQHTTHLCAADADGTIVSLTFTQGPLWFGSGVVAKGTGMILNCGVNLFAEDRVTTQRIAQTNMTPIILGWRNGRRMAFGTPGGRKIPATALAFAVDVVARGDDVATALRNPRVSVTASGQCEAESPLDGKIASCRTIKVEEFYGPASAIELLGDGSARGHTDPRFSGAVATT